jgi:hypothetical protein
MPAITLLFAIVLIGMGLFGYFGADAENRSVTALIPAIVGGILGLCGLLAFNPAMRKHAMHAASAIGLVGFLLAGGRVASVAFSKGLDLSARGTQMLIGMAVVCLVFVALCVNSFIAARRRRAAGETAK